MGTIKNFWKKFKKFIIWAIGFLGFSGITTIVKGWDDIWKVVSAIGKFLISTDGRQLVLSLLVIWLIYKLVRLSKSVRKLSPQNEKGIDEDIKRQKEATQNLDAEFKKLQQELSKVQDKADKYDALSGFNPECTFILARLGESSERELTQSGLFGYYIRNYQFRNSRLAMLKFNIRIHWLEKNDYIRRSQLDDDEIPTLVEITEKGLDYLELLEAKTEEDKKKSP